MHFYLLKTMSYVFLSIFKKNKKNLSEILVAGV